MGKEILLFSGGLDSLVAWYYLGKPTCLYIDLGHRYSIREKRAIHEIKEKTGMKVIIDSRLNLGKEEKPDAHIPMRNSFLLHMAALYGDVLWLVVQKGELNIPDRSRLFISEIQFLLRYLNNNPKIKVGSPFLDMTKTQMVKWYLDNGHPVDVLLSSSSCYNGNNCGYCAACFRRWISLELNGIEEKYKFVEPWNSEIAKEYLKRVHEGKYEPDRADDIIIALEKRGVKI